MKYKVITDQELSKLARTDSTAIVLPIFNHCRMTEPIARHVIQMSLPLLKRVITPALKNYEVKTPKEILAEPIGDATLVLILDACMCDLFGNAFPTMDTGDAVRLPLYLILEN